jgi:4-amino-4-deoxy-L-arabinose transferase-like glycosyltransferase
VNFRSGVIAVLASALLLRLAFALWVPVHPTGDALWYHNYATTLASGLGYIELDWSPAIRWMPGWPVFLGALYAVFGDVPRVGMIANALLGAATAGLLVALGTRLFRERIGLLAGALYAVWPGNVYFAATLLSETLFNFLLVASLTLLTRGTCNRVRGSAWWLLGAGLLMGLAALVKPETLVLTPVAVGFLWASLRSVRELAPRACLVCLMVFLALVPWVYRNYRAFDRLVVTTASGGINAWLGHRPGASGGQDVLLARAYRKRHQQDTWLETSFAVDAAGWRDAWEFARENPGEELRILLRKLWLTYGSDDAAVRFLRGLGMREGLISASLQRRLEWVANLFWCGVMVLALTGLITVRSWRPPTRVLVVGLPGAWLVVHLIFIGGARFHVPETLAYSLAAACGIEWIAQLWRRASVRVFQWTSPDSS